MAVTITQLGNLTVFGDKHVRFIQLDFSGTYPDEGEPLTAAQLGMPNEIDFMTFDGPVVASDGETAIAPRYSHQLEKLVMYESAAAGTAFSEKTASEAYPTGATVRAIVLGH